MVKKKPSIVWDLEAVESLKEIYEYIKQDSAIGAEKIKSRILATVKRLPSHPKLFKEDSLKENNDGTYRVFYVYSYRIVYKVTTQYIIILRIRHTSREPEEY